MLKNCSVDTEWATLFEEEYTECWGGVYKCFGAITSLETEIVRWFGGNWSGPSVTWKSDNLSNGQVSLTQEYLVTADLSTRWAWRSGRQTRMARSTADHWGSLLMGLMLSVGWLTTRLGCHNAGGKLSLVHSTGTEIVRWFGGIGQVQVLLGRMITWALARCH